MATQRELSLTGRVSIISELERKSLGKPKLELPALRKLIQNSDRRILRAL